MTSPRFPGSERGISGILPTALFGGAVAVAVSHLKGEREGYLGDAALGASVGAFLAVTTHVFWRWIEARENERLSESPTSPALAEASMGGHGGLGGLGAVHRTGLAPYPFYRSSVTYPWSEH